VTARESPARRRGSGTRAREAMGVIGAWVACLAAFCVLTMWMARARPDIREAHVALVYLLLLLVGSVTGGRPLGFTIAGLGFVAIDYWFQLPYDTLTVAKPLDWLVLLAFLATAIVTTQLLARARARELDARRHAEEVVRLAREVEHAAALRDADRFKDALLASVSHDFRTPLTTIRALADDLGRTVAPSPDIRASAAVIAEQADRLMHLVENVLDFSRIRGGVLPVTTELNTAEDLIGAATRQAHGVLAGHQLDVEIDWSVPALTGYFDFGHALRALGNLLENAAKHSPPGTPITVSIRRDGGSLAFAVADRGPGVTPVERGRIFDAFYRPVGISPDVGGAGLGLAIARQLAEIQGGAVEYAPREGGGSVFTLRLPGEPDDGAVASVVVSGAGDRPPASVPAPASGARPPATAR
jgi:K+-sensing histidine kinase KdpD